MSGRRVGSRYERLGARRTVVYFDPAAFAGHWADSTFVHRGSGELTIDFVRRTPERHERVLVARAMIMEVVRRIEAMEIRAYEERRRRREAERGD